MELGKNLEKYEIDDIDIGLYLKIVKRYKYLIIFIIVICIIFVLYYIFKVILIY